MSYGCFNRPEFRAVVPVQDGWRTTGGHADDASREPRMVPYRFRMNPSCVYSTSTLGAADPGCAGCKHKSTLPPVTP